jgi:ribosome-binding protein aMBF1 (putative translation factor)
MIMLMHIQLSSSEIISCKECGQYFDTIDALREHEKSEKEDKEQQNKGTLKLQMG